MTGNIQIDQLVRSLLQKDSLEQCSLQELRQFAGRHPYFGAAQLLLTKKMQLEKAEGYSDQLQKTYLFFNNPLWVQRLLGETSELVVEEDPEIAAREMEETPPAPGEKNGIEYPAPTGTENPENAPPVQKQEDVLAFEPYHTIDYFASQGIRYKPEEKPADKFGQQLKSFTDWLKTMKRLSPTEGIPKVEAAQEQKVEQMAERSLDEKDVFTEAMAEVWIKQGNPEKAKSIYEKLSLQDPSKRAYFAAKIEDLKK